MTIYGNSPIWNFFVPIYNMFSKWGNSFLGFRNGEMYYIFLILFIFN